MKYIITESQINKLVFLYLDSQDWHTWDIGDGEFNVADGQYGEDVMKFRIQYSSTINLSNLTNLLELTQESKYSVINISILLSLIIYFID